MHRLGIAFDMLRSSEYPPYGGGPLPAMFRQGTYPFRDLGTHGLYLIEAFLGPMSSLSVVHRESGRDPNLRFDEWYATASNGQAVGRLQISWNVRPMQSRIIVHMTRGVVEVDRFLQTCRVSKSLPGPKFVGAVLTGFLNAVRDAIRIPVNVVRFAVRESQAFPGNPHRSRGICPRHPRRDGSAGKLPGWAPGRGDAGVGLRRGGPRAGNRTASAPAAVYWARVAYNILIPGVVGGMALFVGSDFVRRRIDRRRHLERRHRVEPS